MDIQAYAKEIARIWEAPWYKVLPNDETVTLVPLLYHVAIYIDLQESGDHADRYCFASAELAIRATEEYAETGKMRYWQKWWNANLSSDQGYVWKSGELMEPALAVGTVDWNASELRERYPYPGAARTRELLAR